MSHPLSDGTEFVVDPDLRSAKFACDLGSCLGACCTLPGGRGAPLLDEELDDIRAAARLLAPRLSAEHQEVLRTRGPFEGTPNDMHTTCVDHRACVFVVREGPVARCAIELAHQKGELSFRKPISCHLYPIRIEPGNPARLRYDHLPECRPALYRGAVEDIPLLTFLQPSLERLFGKRWAAVRSRLTP